MAAETLKGFSSQVDTGPMLLPLMTSLLLLGSFSPSHSRGAAQVPLKEAIVPAAIRTADVPTRIELTATHFLAQSRVQESQWLVFKNEELGLLRVRGLRPFETAILPIPAGGAEGMSIEVIGRLQGGTYVSTGLFGCKDIQRSTIFVERTRSALVTWVPRHGGRSLTKLNTAYSAVAPTLNGAAPAALQPHVPVPLPSENRTKKKGRRVSKKKLPPL